MAETFFRKTPPVALAAFAALSFAVLLDGAPHLLAQEENSSPIARQTEAELQTGKSLFDAHCARCHGVGGTGGEGPPLAAAPLRHVSDDESLFRVIQQGIDGTDMPSTWMLSGQETWLVAGYVRSLGRVEEEEPPGDAGRGRAVYEGKGACSVCHIVDGEGGSLGPDLSAVGVTRGVDYLRESLVDPSAHVAPDYLLVRVTTNGGDSLEGARLNEDSFTIQLRDARGVFHSLLKRDLRSLEKHFDESLMPSVAGELTSEELQDLVAFLVSLKGGS